MVHRNTLPTVETIRNAHDDVLGYYLNVQATLSDLRFNRNAYCESWSPILDALSKAADQWHCGRTWFFFRLAADELWGADDFEQNQCVHDEAFTLAEQGLMVLEEIRGGKNILEYFPKEEEPLGCPVELQGLLYEEAARAANIQLSCPSAENHHETGEAPSQSSLDEAIDKRNEWFYERRIAGDT